MINQLTARLEALAAAPKPWLCTVTLSDGTARPFRALSEGAAKAYGQRLADNHGCPFIVTYSPEAES